MGRTGTCGDTGAGMMVLLPANSSPVGGRLHFHSHETHTSPARSIWSTGNKRVFPYVELGSRRGIFEDIFGNIL